MQYEFHKKEKEMQQTFLKRIFHTVIPSDPFFALTKIAKSMNHLRKTSQKSKKTVDQENLWKSQKTNMVGVQVWILISLFHHHYLHFRPLSFWDA